MGAMNEAYLFFILFIFFFHQEEPDAEFEKLQLRPTRSRPQRGSTQVDRYFTPPKVKSPLKK